MEEQTVTVSRESLVTGLNKFIGGGLTLMAFLTPLMFLPVTSDWFEFNKQIFLMFGTGLLTIAFLLRSALTQKLTVRRSLFDLPVLAIAVISVISAIMTANRILNVSVAVLSFLPLTFLFFLVVNTIKEEGAVKRILSAVMGSAVVLSVLTLFQLFISQAIRIPGVARMLNPLTDPNNTSQVAAIISSVLSTGFSPTGSLFAQALFLAAVMPLAILVVYESRKNKEGSLVGSVTPLILTAISLVVTTGRLFLSRPILLDLSTGWRIAAGALGESITTALLGVGTNNYISAFTIHKPVEYNATNLWNLRFNTSTDFPLFLLTTGGIAALAVFVLLVWRYLRTARLRLSSNVATPLEIALTVSAGLSLLATIVFPAPFATLFILYVALGLLATRYFEQKNINFAWESKAASGVSPIMSYVLLVAGVALFAFLAYGGGRVFLADYYFNRAAVAAALNKGADTYNLQIKAIGLNPWNDTYRVAYSQTNLALADALAGQAQTATESGLTEQQRATIIQLVQQSIREGRNAVALNPARAGNWENLTSIYRSLINFAQGADQWAVASQNQAVNLDPNNPRLRLDLGGIFFGLGNYMAAGQAFALAANLKPDYANAHYNLAQAARMLKDLNLAHQELTTTKNLVCNLTVSVNTQVAGDCQKVQDELDEIVKTAAEINKNNQAATVSAQPAAKTVVPPVPIATASAKPTNLNKTALPGAQITSPSGELNR